MLHPEGKTIFSVQHIPATGQFKVLKMNKNK